MDGRENPRLRVHTIEERLEPRQSDMLAVPLVVTHRRIDRRPELPKPGIFNHVAKDQVAIPIERVALCLTEYVGRDTALSEGILNATDGHGRGHGVPSIS